MYAPQRSPAGRGSGAVSHVDDGDPGVTTGEQGAFLPGATPPNVTPSKRGSIRRVSEALKNLRGKGADRGLNSVEDELQGLSRQTTDEKLNSIDPLFARGCSHGSSPAKPWIGLRHGRAQETTSTGKEDISVIASWLAARGIRAVDLASAQERAAQQQKGKSAEPAHDDVGKLCSLLDHLDTERQMLEEATSKDSRPQVPGEMRFPSSTSTEDGKIPPKSVEASPGRNQYEALRLLGVPWVPQHNGVEAPRQKFERSPSVKKQREERMFDAEAARLKQLLQGRYPLAAESRAQHRRQRSAELFENVRKDGTAEEDHTGDVQHDDTEAVDLKMIRLEPENSKSVESNGAAAGGVARCLKRSEDVVLLQAQDQTQQGGASRRLEFGYSVDAEDVLLDKEDASIGRALMPNIESRSIAEEIEPYGFESLKRLEEIERDQLAESDSDPDEHGEEWVSVDGSRDLVRVLASEREHNRVADVPRAPINSFIRKKESITRDSEQSVSTLTSTAVEILGLEEDSTSGEDSDGFTAAQKRTQAERDENSIFLQKKVTEYGTLMHAAMCRDDFERAAIFRELFIKTSELLGEYSTLNGPK